MLSAASEQRFELGQPGVGLLLERGCCRLGYWLRGMVGRCSHRLARSGVEVLGQVVLGQLVCTTGAGKR